jgi:hypothetical protein
MIRNTRAVFLFSLLVTLPLSAFAATGREEELSLKYGMVSDQGPLFAYPSIKLFAASYRRRIAFLMSQAEIGFWSDNATNRMSSVFTFFNIGFQVQPDPFVVYAMLGPGLISGPDELLSTNLQFNTEVGGGLRDRNGFGIDFSYRHISNGGIKLPNTGRNFVQVRLTAPLDYFFPQLKSMP